MNNFRDEIVGRNKGFLFCNGTVIRKLRLGLRMLSTFSLELMIP